MNYIIQNSSGLTLTITDEKQSEYVPIMGGMDTSPTWEEYISDYLEEYKPHMELIKTGIEKLGWVGEKAESKANEIYFVFSDGNVMGFSWRAWGDLMQAIVGKREGYMTYYM